MGQLFSKKDVNIKGLLVSSVQQRGTDNYITLLSLNDEKQGRTKSVWFQVTQIQVKSVSTFITPDKNRRLIVLLYDGNGQSVNLNNPISWGKYEYRLDSKKLRIVYLEKRIRMYNPVQVVNLENLMRKFHNDFEDQNPRFHPDCAVEVYDDKYSDQNVVQCNAAARANVVSQKNDKSSNMKLSLCISSSVAKIMDFVDIPSTVFQLNPDLLGALLVFFPRNAVLCRNFLKNYSPASGTGPVAMECDVSRYQNRNELFHSKTPNTEEGITRAIQELGVEWRAENHGNKSLVRFAIITEVVYPNGHPVNVSQQVELGDVVPLRRLVPDAATNSKIDVKAKKEFDLKELDIPFKVVKKFSGQNYDFFLSDDGIRIFYKRKSVNTHPFSDILLKFGIINISSLTVYQLSEGVYLIVIYTSLGQTYLSGYLSTNTTLRFTTFQITSNLNKKRFELFKNISRTVFKCFFSDHTEMTFSIESDDKSNSSIIELVDA
jgi:hypothetical protein